MKKRSLIVCLVAISLVFAVFLSACSNGQQGVDLGTDQIEIYSDSNERKIVYRVSFDIEQDDIKKSIKAIDESIEDYGWFDYVSTTENYANYTIRVKTDSLDEYLNKLYEEIGQDNIKYFTKSATDVSLSYNSQQHRLKVLEDEKDRLIDYMDSRTLSGSEFLSMNQRISDLEYQIANLKDESLNLSSTAEYSVIEIRVIKETYGWVWALCFGLVIIIGGGAFIAVVLIKQNKKSAAYQSKMQSTK